MGTIVASTRDSAIILTAGSLFTPESRMTVGTTVVLAAPVHKVFDSPQPDGFTFPAKVIACDRDRNVALLGINPGRILPVAHLAPPGRKPEAGMPLISYQYVDSGRIRMSLQKFVRDFDGSIVNGGPYKGLICEGRPRLEEVGMPLCFDQTPEDARDVVLVGVCNYASKSSGAELSEGLGMFAGPEMIRRILASNVVASPGESSEPRSGYAPHPPFPFAVSREEPASEAASGDLPAAVRPEVDPLGRVERRVDEMDRKLDRILESLPGAVDPGKTR
jgi:hypothetical protein